MTEIKKLTQELYERLGCARHPRGKVARTLEKIDLAADELVQHQDILSESWADIIEHLKRCKVNDPNLIDLDFSPDGIVAGDEWLKVNGYIADDV